MEGNYLDLLSAALFRCNQKYYDKVLSAYGLSYSGLIFLISIYEDEGLMLNKLAQDGGFDKGSITKAIYKLEENGFVHIADSKKDKRAKELYTTQKTRDLMPSLYQIRQEYLNYLAEDIDINDFDKYQEVLSHILDKAKEYSSTTIDINNLQICDFKPLSFNDYDDLSCSVIYTGGCNFRCGHCTNKNLVFLSSTQKYKSVKEIIDYLSKRSGMLQGVCIRGGEPLLHEGIFQLLKEIKALGLNVKLSTNGSLFEKIKQAVDLELIDKLEINIMGSRDIYAACIGLDEFDFSGLNRTIDYLKKDVIDYEFSLLLRSSDIDYDDLGSWLKGIKKLNLIRLRETDSCIDTSIQMLKEDEINNIKVILDKYIDNVVIGG
ncbi:MAG: 4Fe-4S cluster-binding domain-containing protein [Erysipelotrichaceae bacterium]